MVAPVVESSSSGHTGNNTNATTHTPSYPSGIASGDLCFLFLIMDNSGGSGDITISDFTATDERDYSSGAFRGYVGYREIDGGEGATFTVTTTNSEHCSWALFRISGHEDPGTQAPEFQVTDSGGNLTDHDCPAITPTGGSKDYLILTGCLVDTGNTAITGWPYTNNQIDDGGNTTGNDTTIGASNDAVTAATIDPGSFTSSLSRPSLTYTVAIHPSGGVADITISIPPGGTPY